MTLDTWRANGWLRDHETSPREIQELVAVAGHALANAAVEGPTPDARIGLAYAAVLAIGTAGPPPGFARVWSSITKG